MAQRVSRAITRSGKKFSHHTEGDNDAPRKAGGALRRHKLEALVGRRALEAFPARSCSKGVATSPSERTDRVCRRIAINTERTVYDVLNATISRPSETRTRPFDLSADPERELTIPGGRLLQ